MQPSLLSTDRIERPSPYRGEMRTSSIFSTEVERALYYRWRHRCDASAAHQLLGNYLHLGAEVAKGYAGCGITLKELIGEGYVGLMRAVCRFDPDRGVRFMHYAIWHVREAIHEYMLQATGPTFFRLVQFNPLPGAPVDLLEIAGSDTQPETFKLAECSGTGCHQYASDQSP